MNTKVVILFIIFKISTIYVHPG